MRCPETCLVEDLHKLQRWIACGCCATIFRVLTPRWEWPGDRLHP